MRWGQALTGVALALASGCAVHACAAFREVGPGADAASGGPDTDGAAADAPPPEDGARPDGFGPPPAGRDAGIPCRDLRCNPGTESCCLGPASARCIPATVTCEPGARRFDCAGGESCARGAQACCFRPSTGARCEDACADGERLCISSGPCTEAEICHYRDGGGIDLGACGPD